MSDHESSSDQSVDESADESAGEPAAESTGEHVAEPAAEESTAESESPDASAQQAGRTGKRSVLRYLEWAGLALCILLVLVAGLRVYSGVGAFISLWVASRYEPIVSAGFNLAVLLAAAYGAAILSRRLTSSS